MEARDADGAGKWVYDGSGCYAAVLRKIAVLDEPRLAHAIMRLVAHLELLLWLFSVVRQYGVHEVRLGAPHRALGAMNRNELCTCVLSSLTILTSPMSYR